MASVLKVFVESVSARDISAWLNEKRRRKRGKGQGIG